MKGEYFRITLLVMFLSFLGTIYLEPSLSRFQFVELFIIILGLLFAFLVLYGIAAGKRWAWPAATIFFSLALINTSLIWAYYTLSTALVCTYFFEIIGWLLAVANLGLYDMQREAEEVSDVDISPPENPRTNILQTYDSLGVKPEVVINNNYETRKTKNVFEPGKYIASKTGKKYHVPECDWAGKIKTKKRVWFNTDKEAKKEGYKACNCTK